MVLHMGRRERTQEPARAAVSKRPTDGSGSALKLGGSSDSVLEPGGSSDSALAPGSDSALAPGGGSGSALTLPPPVSSSLSLPPLGSCRARHRFVLRLIKVGNLIGRVGRQQPEGSSPALKSLTVAWLRAIASLRTVHKPLCLAMMFACIDRRLAVLALCLRRLAVDALSAWHRARYELGKAKNGLFNAKNALKKAQFFSSLPKGDLPAGRLRQAVTNIMRVEYSAFRKFALSCTL
mmetsp:Transcript_44328/g.103951  ORF Transcript_44328/g.103951 Transcript_44328/m.103951 type:complete len:236 (+) Transcript_44328:159-866(+)